MSQFGQDGHRHRWRFREIREPGLRRTRIEYRCGICDVLAVVGGTGGLEGPDDEPSTSARE